MIDVHVYYVDLPSGVHEMVTPGTRDDYTVYLDSKDGRTNRIKHFSHALRHIRNRDFEKDDVQEIENTAHKEGKQ